MFSPDLVFLDQEEDLFWKKTTFFFWEKKIFFFQRRVSSRNLENEISSE